jgi:uncharacterized protein (DUF58 family)
MNIHQFLLDARHLLVEADHFSFVNRYLPWRYPLGGLAMAAVSSLLCAWFIHVQAYTLLIGVCAVLMLGLIWPWVSMRAIRGRLSFERSRTVEGRAVSACLTVTNYLPIGIWGLRLYGGAEGWGGKEAVINLAEIPGWRTSEYIFPFVPPARGVYPSSQATLSTGFPFGLWEARRPLAVEDQLIVWPGSFELGPVPESAASDRTREGPFFLSRPGHAGDFHGVRPYVRGDSLRRVHWAQTAKRGELIVCERQASANVHLQIILDADPAVHRGGGPRSSREWAIRATASLIESFLASGALVELLVGEVHVPTGSGGKHRQKLLDVLAKLTERGVPPVQRLLSSPPAQRFGSGLQVVVTTDQGIAAVDPASLRRHSLHLILFRAAAFDPRGTAEPPPRGIPTGWIAIDSADDVPSTFRRSWRQVLHAN